MPSTHLSRGFGKGFLDVLYSVIVSNEHKLLLHFICGINVFHVFMNLNVPNPKNYSLVFL